LCAEKAKIALIQVALQASAWALPPTPCKHQRGSGCFLWRKAGIGIALGDNVNNDKK